MDSFATDALTIDPVRTGQKLTLKWLGKSRDRQPTKVIGPYLSRAIDHARENTVQLEMVFGALDYLNSGTVMAIVQSIHLAKKAGVRLTLAYDDRVEWQRLSFEPLKVFADPDSVEIRGCEQ